MFIRVSKTPAGYKLQIVGDHSEIVAKTIVDTPTLVQNPRLERELSLTCTNNHGNMVAFAASTSKKIPVEGPCDMPPASLMGAEHIRPLNKNKMED